MPKSSATAIHFRGVNPTITPSKYEKNITLKHKKLLTKELKEKLQKKSLNLNTIMNQQMRSL